MPQTIVIGIGGTGLDIIRCLRRRIVENHGTLDHFRHLRFLYIDTDATSVAMGDDLKKRWQVLGKDTFLGPAEYCLISVEEPGAILQNLNGYEQVKSWFPAENLEGIEQTARNNPGASQIRPLGRLGFIMKAGEVEMKFKAILNSIPSVPGGGNVQVYLACSLSGGTGSGAFLDLAYRIRRWAAGNCETYGFLVLPSLTENRGDRYLANAYAALLELNYYSLSRATPEGRTKPIEFRIPLALSGEQGAPFENCYLISPRNSARVTLSLEGLAEMVAHRLYLSLDQAIANDAAALMSNCRAERGRTLSDPFGGQVHSQNFSTFGLASIQYPVQLVTEILAYRIADEVFFSWVKPRIGAPQNVNQQVVADLSELWLTDGHLRGDLDLFGGGNNYDGIASEVKAYVTEARKQAPAKRLATFMSDRFNAFASTFRTGGVMHYYQGLLDNLRGAGNVIMGRVQSKLSAIILDRDLGYPFAVEYLNELIKLLDTRSQSNARYSEGLPSKTLNSRTALNGAFNQLNEADNSLLFHDRRVQEAMQRVTQAMEMNLIAAAETAAYSYDSQLLAVLDSRLKELRSQLEAWKDAIIRLRNTVKDEIRGRQDFLGARSAATAELNGAILFREQQVEAMYSELSVDQARTYVLDRLLGAAKDPIAAIREPDHAIKVAYEHAIRWLDEVSAVRVSSKNVADRLLEEYPDSREAERFKLLNDNLRNSGPFLDFDEAEKGLYQQMESAGYQEAASKHARVVGLIGDQQNKLPAVARIRQDLVSRVGLAPGELKQISDSSEILFLQEAGAFPLRLIKDLKTLREAYRKLCGTRSLPLHVERQYDPPLQNLFLTTDQERTQQEQAEEDFLVGWVEGRIRVENNPREERDEVRYRYYEAGADRYFFLAPTRDAAFARWMQNDPEIAAHRARLAEENRRFRDSLDSQAARRQFSSSLAGHLDQLKAEYPYHEEDERYQKFSAIRARIFVSWRLPEPARPETGAPAAPQA